MGMAREEAKDQFGDNADTMCRILCGYCTANDWYCPSDCDFIAWVRRNYDKAIERMAKLDGDYVEFSKRYRHWK